MIRINAACLTLLLACTSLYGQTLYYDVIRNDKSMGQTVVKRILKGEELTYHLNTKTELRVIFLFDIEYDLKETFKKGKLLSGTGFNTLNGSVQKETQMVLKEKFYELVIDGIRTEIHETNITESVSEIYFEEPHHSKQVFSAYFGRYLDFEKVGERQYSLTSPDGTNVYTYENGICTKVKVTRDFATFEFILKPESLMAVRNKQITGKTYD